MYGVSSPAAAAGLHPYPHSLAGGYGFQSLHPRASLYNTSGYSDWTSGQCFWFGCARCSGQFGFKSTHGAF